MNPEKESGLFAHDADGITELDNQLPRWWLWLFILTVIWAVGYLFYFEIARIGLTSSAAYEAEMAAAGKNMPAADATPPEPSTDNAVLSSGQMVFLKNCVTCHGPQGGGLIGPNLCDNFFIHGPAFADTVHTIREGVPAKGMITWKTVLKPQDIQAVASYVWKLRGTSPSNPKAPQGDPYVPPAPGEADTNAPPATASDTNAPAAQG
ncbi:MAG: c-type cytochrome [Lentisphaerae bacterium]|nr:c-type cytochrome [Lentisphaerota bacterium]